MNQTDLNNNFANAVLLYLKDNNIPQPTDLTQLGLLDTPNGPPIVNWKVQGIAAPTNAQLLQYTLAQVQQQQTYYIASQQANSVVIPVMTTTDLNNLTNISSGAIAYDSVKHQIQVFYNGKWN